LPSQHHTPDEEVREVSRGRPLGRHSLQSHEKRSEKSSSTSPRRIARLGLLAAAATAVIVGTGTLVSGAAQPGQQPDAATANRSDAGIPVPQIVSSARDQRVSRSTERPPVPRPVARAAGKLWTTAHLDVRTAPKNRARTLGTLHDGVRVPVTGRRQNGFAQVIVRGAPRWVTAQYLSAKKEVLPGSKGLVDKSCPGTSGVESGLTSGAVRVYRAVCNNFPQITQYGGYAARGEHASGKAIDIMTSDTGLGDQIAAFLQRNAGALDLYDVIWHQRIWTPVRASEGWRSMSDRGSETANHYDHVHVSVN
jgi:hypothetical protein